MKHPELPTLSCSFHLTQNGSPGGHFGLQSKYQIHTSHILTLTHENINVTFLIKRTNRRFDTLRTTVHFQLEGLTGAPAQ